MSVLNYCYLHPEDLAICTNNEKSFLEERCDFPEDVSIPHKIKNLVKRIWPDLRNERSYVVFLKSDPDIEIHKNINEKHGVRERLESSLENHLGCESTFSFVVSAYKGRHTITSSKRIDFNRYACVVNGLPVYKRLCKKIIDDSLSSRFEEAVIKRTRIEIFDNKTWRLPQFFTVFLKCPKEQRVKITAEGNCGLSGCYCQCKLFTEDDKNYTFIVENNNKSVQKSLL